MKNLFCFLTSLLTFVLISSTLIAQSEIAFTSSDNIKGWDWDGQKASYITELNGKIYFFSRPFDGKSLRPVSHKMVIIFGDAIRGWDWDGQTASFFAFWGGKTHLIVRPFDGNEFGMASLDYFFSSEDNLKSWEWDKEAGIARYIGVLGGKKYYFIRSFDGKELGPVQHKLECESFVRSMVFKGTKVNSLVYFKNGKTKLIAEQKEPIWIPNNKDIKSFILKATSPNSKNVTRVEYENGYFQQLENLPLFSLENGKLPKWVESNDNGTYYFVEFKGGNNGTSSRTDSSVFLFDPSRGYYVELNIAEKTTKIWSITNPKKLPLYTITGTAAGYIPNVSSMVVKPGKYYRLQLKTNPDFCLKIWDSGRVGASEETNLSDDRSQWLLIPTGDEIDTYWIFGKGARNGRGHIMAQPDGIAQYQQWDFLENDNRQKFKLQDEGNGYYRIVQKGTKKAVSTRHHQMAFAWDINPTDDAQLFKLVETGSFGETDVLPGYLFWNYDNERIKDYFKVYCQKVPNPTLVRIEKITIINASSQEIIPAIHKHGCAGVPWRNGLAQCDAKTLKKDEEWTFEVDYYLRNAEEIWSIIGWTGAIAGGIAISVVTIVFAPAAVAALFGGAEITAEIVTIGAAVAKVVIGLVDVFIFSKAIPGLFNSSIELSAEDDISLRGWFKDKGLDEKTLPLLNQKLGDDYFYAGEKVYKDLMGEFYIEETKSKTQIKDLFYGNGQCIFVISDATIGK